MIQPTERLTDAPLVWAMSTARPWPSSGRHAGDLSGPPLVLGTQAIQQLGDVGRQPVAMDQPVGAQVAQEWLRSTCDRPQILGR
jgi:hypothetical protein